jgi:hypothetical protein
MAIMNAITAGGIGQPVQRKEDQRLGDVEFDPWISRGAGLRGFAPQKALDTSFCFPNFFANRKGGS